MNTFCLSLFTSTTEIPLEKADDALCSDQNIII